MYRIGRYFEELRKIENFSETSALSLLKFYFLMFMVNFLTYLDDS